MSLEESLGSVFADCDHPVTKTDDRGKPYCDRCGADLSAEVWG